MASYYLIITININITTLTVVAFISVARRFIYKHIT